MLITERRGSAPRKLYNSLVQERHPHFKAVCHAHPVDFCQYALEMPVKLVPSQPVSKFQLRGP